LFGSPSAPVNQPIPHAAGQREGIHGAWPTREMAQLSTGVVTTAGRVRNWCFARSLGYITLAMFRQPAIQARLARSAPLTDELAARL